MSGARTRRSAGVVVAAVLAVVFGTGATPGDIGGCGSRASDLDVGAFAKQRKDVDCARCQDCGLTTKRCTRACDPKAAPDFAVPSTCHPLAHDGDVCLRALRAASCDDYGRYVDDEAPTSPTECEFCRIPAEDGGP